MEDVIIIGGGPAGLSAAIYLARANLNPLVLAGSPPGGQLMLTSAVENYPGFESILGSELIERMRNQAKKFGARIVDENVVEVNFNKSEIRNPKSEANSNVKNLNDQNSFKNLNLEHSDIVSNFDIRASRLYSTKSVLIATGAKALWLGLESETRLRGKGVSACATCDGFFFKDRVVGVVGGGDTALEEALTLTKLAKKVYIIHRRDSFRASKVMQERVFKNPKIEIIYNAVVEEIMGEKKVEGVRLKIVNPKSEIRNPKQTQNPNDQNSKSLGHLNLDGLFIAIGHKPETEIFAGQVELDDKGYIITSERLAIEYFKTKIIKSQTPNSKQISNSNDQNSKQFEKLKIENWKLFGNWNLKLGIYRSPTSVNGVFAAGDCVDSVYRQAGTAAGAGIAAALEAQRWLESQPKGL